jgi:hypothetical protein
MQRIESMGMLVVLGVVVFIAVIWALFFHAVRAPSGGRHGWIVVLPLVVAAAWLIEQLVVAR